MAFCFEFFVTNVERDGQFLKLWGHKDRNAALNVERTIQQSFRDFEKGVGVPDPRTLMPNLFCCARYTDGAYYRAKVTHVDWNNGNVFVFFIDYGNGDRVPMSDLRSLDPSSVLLKIPPQASCFFLAGVVGTWEPAILDHIKNIILYNELKALVTQSIGQHNVLKLYMERNQDFSETLVRAGFASEVSSETFEVMVWRASAGSTTQGLPAAYSIPNPMWSMMHRPSYPNLMNPGVLPMQPPAVTQPLPTPTTATAVDMRKSSFPIYPSLDLNSEHSVFISFCDSDTKTIYVQLTKDQSELEKISETLNTPAPPLRQMCPPFVPGRICIARSSEDEVLYRAVITKISSDVEVYFVDYGNVDHVKPSEVYEIPSDLSHLQVMAIPFSFADDLDVSDELFGTVMELVNEKPAILEVVASKDVGTKQFCNLFIEETNVIDAARTELLKREPKLAFRNMPVPTPGGKVKVTVAYVKSVDNFYVQLAASQQDLESLMADVNSYCNSSAAKMQPSDIQPGAPCCALFPADGQWYRAMITNARLEELSVMYVDYGNEERVTMADLRVANEPIVNKLLAQAIPCRLSGFDAKPDKQLDQRFEELVIEESFTMHVVKIITEVPCIVVKLLDDSGVDIASKLHSAPVPIHHLNGNAIAPPCDVKVGVSSSGEREVVLSRGSSFHPRSINGIPVGQHQEKDNSHRPPKVFGSVDRESVRSRESSFHPRSINGKPVSQYQGGEDSYCPKKDPVAWGIGENQKQGPAFGHCDRSATSTYDTSEDAPSIQYSCMAIGDQKPVVIVFSNSPKDFYVQYRPADSKFDLLTEQIEQMFADGGDTLDRSMVVVGTACVAKYTEDGCYYRAEIKQVQRDGALVNFVDYGNMEVVSFDDLKRIPKSLCALQAQAFHCSLKGVPNCSQDTVKSKFNELLDSQSLVAEILDVKDHLYQIILRDSNESLSINEKFGALSSDLLSPNSTVKSVPNLCFPDGTVSEITVTWFKSPDNFCVRQKSFEEDFDQMMTQIQKEYKKKECVAAPSIGDAVIVKHTDGYYYRATVCILKGTKFGVKFIDFGDKCLVDPSAIFGLELQYSSLPALAIQCHLDAVKPVRGDQFLPYSTDISELFGGDLMCTFTSHSPSGYLVNCKRNGQDLAQQLIAKKLALSSLEKDLQKLSLSTNKNKRELKEGSEHTSIFSYIVSPDEFYLHLENEASDLENLQAELQTCANSMQAMPGKPAPGTICMAIFEDAWYRGLVRPNSSIFYLDYGNTEAYPEDKNNVRMLPQHLQEMPGFAVRCQFQLPLNSKWAPNALEQLTQYFEEAESLPLLILAVKPESYEVKISALSSQIDSLLIVEEVVKEPCQRKKRELKEGSEHTSIFSYIVSPDEFYLHLENEASDLENLQAELQTCANSMQAMPGKPAPGTICMAIFEDAWYRGLVLPNSSIFYLDYGNTEAYPEDENNVRMLPEHLQEMPGFAVRCQFQLPLNSKWAPNALEQLTQYFEEAETLPLQIHAVKPNSFVVTIKNVSDKLGLVIVEELLSASCGVGATIVNFTSPDDFYMHLDEHSDKVEEVARQLLNADLFPKSDEWNTGDTCAALFDEDNLWYRAEIVSISEPYYVVRYVDYGNESTTHALRKLPENLMIPPLGYHCALPLPSGLVWNEPAKAYLQELVDSESKFEVEFLTKDDPILVNLKSNNLNINHELASCCGYEKDLIEAHIASLRASVEGNENVASELPPNENAAPTSGDIATSNEVSVSLTNSNEFKPVEFSDMEDVTVRDVDTENVVNGAEVLEILDVTSTAISERKSSTDDVQILFESGESSLGGSVVEIPVEHSVITIGVASELPPNENAALTSGDIAPSNEVSVSLTNSNEFKPVEFSDIEEITERDVDTENVVNGAEVLEILDVTSTATGEMKSSTDDVQILFESRESSLDGSVVEIPVEHSVITIGDDSDDEIVEHCPKSSEAMPDLITPMESSNRNTGGNCDVDQDITHLVESFCQSLSLVNGNGADSLPDVHCGIEKDTSVSCPEIRNLLPNTECQPWSVASLHTYPNSQACEIDVEGTCLGYCKAEPSDLDLDVSSFTPGTKFYIFDDCEIHRSIVTVRSSIK